MSAMQSVRSWSRSVVMWRRWRQISFMGALILWGVLAQTMVAYSLPILTIDLAARGCYFCQGFIEIVPGFEYARGIGYDRFWMGRIYGLQTHYVEGAMEAYHKTIDQITGPLVYPEFGPGGNYAGTSLPDLGPFPSPVPDILPGEVYMQASILIESESFYADGSMGIRLAENRAYYSVSTGECFRCGVGWATDMIWGTTIRASEFPVPEPPAWGLLGSAFLGLLFRPWRKEKLTPLSR